MKNLKKLNFTKLFIATNFLFFLNCGNPNDGDKETQLKKEDEYETKRSKIENEENLSEKEKQQKLKELELQQKNEQAEELKQQQEDLKKKQTEELKQQQEELKRKQAIELKQKEENLKKLQQIKYEEEKLRNERLLRNNYDKKQNEIINLDISEKEKQQRLKELELQQKNEQAKLKQQQEDLKKKQAAELKRQQEALKKKQAAKLKQQQEDLKRIQAAELKQQQQELKKQQEAANLIKQQQTLKKQQQPKQQALTKQQQISGKQEILKLQRQIVDFYVRDVKTGTRAYGIRGIDDKFFGNKYLSQKELLELPNLLVGKGDFQEKNLPIYDQVLNQYQQFRNSLDAIKNKAVEKEKQVLRKHIDDTIKTFQQKLQKLKKTQDNPASKLENDIKKFCKTFDKDAEFSNLKLLTEILMGYADETNDLNKLGIVLDQYIKYKKRLINIQNSDKNLLDHINQIMRYFIRKMNSPELNVFLPSKKQIKVLRLQNKNKKNEIWCTHVQIQFIVLDKLLKNNKSLKVWFPASGKAPNKHQFGTGIGGGSNKERKDLFTQEITKLQKNYPKQVKFAVFESRDKIKEGPQYGVSQIHITENDLMAWAGNMKNWNEMIGNGSSWFAKYKLKDFVKHIFGGGQAENFDMACANNLPISSMYEKDEKLLEPSNINHSLTKYIKYYPIIFG